MEYREFRREVCGESLVGVEYGRPGEDAVIVEVSARMCECEDPDPGPETKHWLTDEAWLSDALEDARRKAAALNAVDRAVPSAGQPHAAPGLSEAVDDLLKLAKTSRRLEHGARRPTGVAGIKYQGGWERRGLSGALMADLPQNRPRDGSRDDARLPDADVKLFADGREFGTIGRARSPGQFQVKEIADAAAALTQAASDLHPDRVPAHLSPHLPGLAFKAAVFAAQDGMGRNGVPEDVNGTYEAFRIPSRHSDSEQEVFTRLGGVVVSRGGDVENDAASHSFTCERFVSNALNALRETRPEFEQPHALVENMVTSLRIMWINLWKIGNPNDLMIASGDRVRVDLSAEKDQWELRMGDGREVPQPDKWRLNWPRPAKARTAGIALRLVNAGLSLVEENSMTAMNVYSAFNTATGLAEDLEWRIPDGAGI